MSIKHIVVPRTSISLGGQTFEVRGLSSNDLQTLLIKHTSDINKAFDTITAMSKQLETDDQAIMQVIASMLQAFPQLISDIIALAADEPDAGALVMTFPVTVQAEAIVAIWNSTFSEDGSLKKFVDLVLLNFPKIREAMVQTAARLQVSQSGSGK